VEGEVDLGSVEIVKEGEVEREEVREVALVTVAAEEAREEVEVLREVVLVEGEGHVAVDEVESLV